MYVFQLPRYQDKLDACAMFFKITHLSDCKRVRRGAMREKGHVTTLVFWAGYCIYTAVAAVGADRLLNTHRLGVVN